MKVTYDDEGFTYVTYRDDKRPLKLGVFFADSPERLEYFGLIAEFVYAAANKPEHIAKMEPAKYWALVERLSTLFCRYYSPTKEWGVTKPEIRGAVYFVLDAGRVAGEWPNMYTSNRQTFVQFGGDIE